MVKKVHFLKNEFGIYYAYDPVEKIVQNVI